MGHISKLLGRPERRFSVAKISLVAAVNFVAVLQWFISVFDCISYFALIVFDQRKVWNLILYCIFRCDLAKILPQMQNYLNQFHSSFIDVICVLIFHAFSCDTFNIVPNSPSPIQQTYWYIFFIVNETITKGNWLAATGPDQPTTFVHLIQPTTYYT